MNVLAQKAIYEFDAKNLIGVNLKKYSRDVWNYERITMISVDTDIGKWEKENPWLKTSRLVIKPDVLAGKRGKSGFIGLDLKLDEVKEYLRKNLGQEVKVGNDRGVLYRFIVEPYILHEKEYYASISSNRTHEIVTFSDIGGMNIEEEWEKTQSIQIPIGCDPSDVDFGQLLTKSSENAQEITKFLENLLRVYIEQDFCFIEINPFTIVKNVVIPLDAKAKLDDTSHFLHKDTWGNPENPVSFPTGFGQTKTKEEVFIQQLDKMTGASLKLTILNAEGSIWTMIAGGGASVIYADTIVDQGFGHELANYGEYSGNPTEEHTKLYAQTLIDLMCSNKSEKKKILIIGGGIANFTDVRKTFLGIAAAIRKSSSKLITENVSIYVRRGGPNEKEGLMMMTKLGEDLGIPIHVYDRYTPMIRIIRYAQEESH